MGLPSGGGGTGAIKGRLVLLHHGKKKKARVTTKESKHERTKPPKSLDEPQEPLTVTLPQRRKKKD